MWFDPKLSQSFYNDNTTIATSIMLQIIILVHADQEQLQQFYDKTERRNNGSYDYCFVANEPLTSRYFLISARPARNLRVQPRRRFPYRTRPSLMHRLLVYGDSRAFISTLVYRRSRTMLKMFPSFNITRQIQPACAIFVSKTRQHF